MATEAGTKGRARKEGKRGRGGIGQRGVLEVNGGRRGGRNAGHDAVLGVINIEAKGGVAKQALIIGGQEVGIGVHSAVDADGLEAHSKIGDV